MAPTKPITSRVTRRLSRSPRRLAAQCYRRIVRRYAALLPERTEDEHVAVFEALQDDATEHGGWTGLLGCWAAECAGLWRLRAGAAAEGTRRALLPPPSGRSGGLMVDSLLHDLRDAWRSIRRTPGHAAVVVTTLALGIGANVAIFSVVDALFFKRLPYEAADRLMLVAEWPDRGGNFTVAPDAFIHWRRSAQSWAHLEARRGGTLVLLSGGDPEEVRGARVTAGYFELLGARPAVGRTLGSPDLEPDAPCAAVVSHRLWVRRFGADPSLLGQAIRTSEATCYVVGILPAESPLDSSPNEIYLPLSFTPAQAQSRGRMLTVMGRLRAGVTPEEASEEMNTLAAAFNPTRGEAGRGWTVRLTPWRDVLVRTESRRLAWILFGAVGLVLAIACANVAGLTLAHLAARQHESAVRTALGASRWRTCRRLLVESLVLAGAGGVLGAVVGSWALQMLTALAPSGTFPPEAAPVLDARAFVFTAVIALATGVIFGTLPAWHAGRAPAAGLLQASGRVFGSRMTLRLHAGLTATQMGLAMILVMSAALLIASLAKLSDVRPGFEPDAVLTFRLSAPNASYPGEAQVADFFARVLEEIRRAPGVEQAGAVTSLPLDGWLWGTRAAVVGMPVDPSRPPAGVHIQHVTDGYVEALRIPITAGRSIQASDTARAPLVAMVNETFVRQFLDGRAPLGQRLDLGITPEGRPVDATWEIVGVLGDVKTGSLADPDFRTPEVYIPHTQAPMSAMALAVRASGGDPLALLKTVTAAVGRVDAERPLGDPRTMIERIGLSLRTARFRMVLLSSFALLAGALATLGVYAVRSRAVAARAREFGVRVALGARSGDVLRLVLLQGLRLTAVGLVAGFVAALFASRVLEQWLFEARATDPLIGAAAVIVLGGAALAASWLPARRAASVNPLIMLRE